MHFRVASITIRREMAVALRNAELTIKASATLAGCSCATVSRGRQRMATMGKVDDLPRSGRPRVYSQATELKLIGFYCQTQPLPGCGRWTLRWAHAYLQAHPTCIGAQPGKSTIQRILKHNRLKPHQSRYFLHITDPDFFPKMEHLVQLYLNPPPNLFFFDECPNIQILQRLLPDLQSVTMKKRLEEFEYIRHGTMDVLAFLHHADGKVYAECHADHTTRTFLGIFRRHLLRCPGDEQIHYVMDNLVTHISYPFCQLVAALSGIDCPSQQDLDKPSKRADWLRSPDKRIVIHFTPYHGSWLNLIEIWFGIMNKKVLQESYAGAARLKQSLDAFVDDWNLLLAHPFRWTYTGEGLHEKAVCRFTRILSESASEFETATLTKQLKLMRNLLTDYAAEIATVTIQLFIDTLYSQIGALQELIQKEKGPIRKKNAEDALQSLIAFTECYKNNDNNRTRKAA